MGGAMSGIKPAPRPPLVPPIVPPLSGFFGPAEAPMFVATRENAKDPDPGTIRFDARKRPGGDLIGVSGAAEGGRWQIKLLFKNAYPNPPAWKTCVLVVRVPPRAFDRDPGLVPLLTIGKAVCGDPGCAQYKAANDAAGATRTLWYNMFSKCLLFGRTVESAMCAGCFGAAHVQQNGLNVAIRFTERGDARQLVIVRDFVGFYDSLTDKGVLAQRPDASVLATGKVLLEMSPAVSDVALLAHHDEVGAARPAIESWLEAARREASTAGRARPAVEAVAKLAREVLATEFVPTTQKPGSYCPCR
jgi:hypothetical protein